MMKKILAFVYLFIAMAFSPLGSAGAANTVVTPVNTQGWSPTQQDGDSTYSFVSDPASTLPEGALELKTSADPASIIQYTRATNTKLSDVNTLSYAAKNVSGQENADPLYTLGICLGGVVNGGCSGYTTMNYEPRYNQNSDAKIAPNLWQGWNVADGQMWSSKDVALGTCVVAARPGGPPTYKLADIKTNCPDAIVVAYGVTLSTPSSVMRVDELNFDGTVYDFQMKNTVKDKSECKNNGFKNVTDNNGNSFKSQGQCQSYISSNKTAAPKQSGGVLHSLKTFITDHL